MLDIEISKTYVPVIFLAVTTVLAYIAWAPKKVKAPQVGYGWFSSSSDPDIRRILSEGYTKFPSSFFKIKLHPFGSVTILTQGKLLNELRNAPDNDLDFEGGAARSILPKYTMSPMLSIQSRHIPAIRTTLTRNLSSLFGDIIDEMKHSFDAHIALSGQDWGTFTAYPTLMKIICGTSNRVIIGLPYCRDKEYCKLNSTFTLDVVKTGREINEFPEILHPFVGPLYSKSKDYQKRILHIIGPAIKYRRQMLDKYGPDWADKPNDYLMWIMEDEMDSFRDNLQYIAVRILQVNFAALHTSTASFTHALYYLAINPEYADTLREEAFAVIKQEGWTKAAMRDMKKVDSFLRESARLNTLSLLTLVREAKRDYTFSNGLVIPKGNFVGTALYSVHRDEELYKDAHEFKPWRFVDAEVADKDGLGMSQYVATSAEFLSFGFGKHACPGRFFAVNELKAMLCYIVMNYDVQLEGGSKERPANTFRAARVMPDTTAKVMFRKRSI